MEKIKEIIVVEGRDDTRRIQESLEADTIETRGSAINEDILEMIAKAQETRGVIVFTDPDFPGEKIRKIISRRIPGVKHAFLKVEDAKPKGKGSLGIEHASPEAIREALSKVYTEMVEKETLIPRILLIDAGLLAGTNSKKRREKLGEHLNIGYTNGKQLEKRLQMFQITPTEVIEAMKQILEEENDPTT
ncbi:MULTISPECIES: ribonuclease M5 [Carnobacterium]|uniref:ribonuclease M5 n=1 Tax=Carnobacterium TaxID=2747 RepID=UPI001072D81A|nr:MULTISPECIES: ribonuclease M5 [Carnobacterium]MDT1940261.1 ribonuclease M5 [Carnobacterium divergens]MDT1942699.1 ribonuclease M5 [Carnobacterium divergens]MDT1948505.1 ribonuclease M5 [Carnobacterium divergens]MDT1950986.1 ribonuclease M5 [Carnobacterium divergens]MDT1955816.1 ribonuclease M5 [Carnobacterium divergens]